MSDAILTRRREAYARSQGAPAVPSSDAVAAVGAPASAELPATGRLSSAALTAGPVGPASPGSFLPMPTLPKGGGAIRGLGETFTISPARGTGSLAVPLALSRGRGGGAEPVLELRYDSAAGNSPFGLGFHLRHGAAASIARRTDRGVPRYLDDDVFLLGGGEELVPALVGAAWQPDRYPVDMSGVAHLAQRYRPRVEGAFARIEHCQPVAGGVPFWRVVSRDNVTSVYGRTGAARVTDPDDQSRVFEWLLEEVHDDRGNLTVYTYKAENLNDVDAGAVHEGHRFGAAAPAGRYLKTIRYANRTPGDPSSCALQVVFDYGDHDTEVPTPVDSPSWPVRPDPFSTYRAGFEVRTWRLCRRILMFHDFAELGDGPLPRLVRSTDLTYQLDPVATRLASVTQTGYVWAGGAYQRRSLPPVEFGYTRSGPDATVRSLDTVDGAPLVGGSVHEPADETHWVDLDGEGLPGALTRHGGGWWYQRNLGQARLGARRQVRTWPSVGQSPAGQGEALRLVDVAGAGRVAVVEWGPDRYGFVERDLDSEHGWGPFTPFRSIPVLDFTDPGLRQVDLDGDGLPDLLFAEGESLRWHRSLGRAGFGAAQTVLQGADEGRSPLLILRDESRTIHLADMSGDGLTDLVRVRRGEVCYWPNLGHGRFGPKVVMSGSPIFDHPELMDPGRVRLGDVDGTGPADLIYLARDGVRYWRNLAGNGFGPAQELGPFPACDELSTVELTDLLGTGTSCLVWSSPSTRDDADRVRYLDLCRGLDADTDPDDPELAGVKPYLLNSVENNLGARTRVWYAPSTRHYLAANLTDEPWLTRLPFPVYVVDRTETIDQVSQTRLTRRHRYWHGIFDQLEREFRGFALTETVDAESVPAPTGPESGSSTDLPPVRSRNWFHSGVFPDLVEEPTPGRWSGDPVAAPLGRNDVAGAASGEEIGQAHRALAGLPMRTEIFSYDGADAAPNPYLVVCHRHRAVRVQPARYAKSAVFFTHALESVTYHYERNSADPRVWHDLTLDVDEYGTVRHAATVGYRRRVPVIDEQAQTLVMSTLTDVTHTTTSAVHRLATPVRTRAYQVTGLPDPGQHRYDYETFRKALNGPVAEISYEHTAPPGVARRLIEETRIGYWSDTLAVELAPGAVGARALPRQSYHLALTPGLLATWFGDHVTDDVLGTEGGYVWLDGAWWMPSGVQLYDPAAFFLPVALRSPFGNTSSVHYDDHQLLVVSAKASQTAPYDVLLSTMDNDYRVLTPHRSVDPNGNRSWVTFDPLGFVAAAWTAGKVGDPDGDPDDLPGTVFTYDLDEWRLHGRPVWAQIDRRERHGDPDGPWQRQRVYSDGFGRIVMSKAQSEPGPAWTLDSLGQLVQVDTTPEVRWVGTGRTVFNNKGLPVERYEPYFSATVEFEDEDALVKQGVTVLTRYDPLGRVVRTDHPDGTLTRVEFDPWQQRAWDPNDTVRESAWYAQRGSPDPIAAEPADPEQRAAWLAAHHAGTPTVSILDSLGRVVRTRLDNGAAAPYETRVVLDIEGNVRAVVDARGVAVFGQVYDVAGRVLHTTSPDAGLRWHLPDGAGNPMRAWDARGAATRHGYDPLRRTTHTWVRRSVTGPEELATLVMFGEADPDAVARNLRGRASRVYDGAGLIRTEWVDFKGNPVVESRRLATSTQPAPDWSPLDGLAPENLDAAAGALLAPGGFTTGTEYDALDRTVAQTLPDGTVLLPRYNEAGLLEAVSARLRGAAEPTAFVTDLDYDAKGQRLVVEYANGVQTKYTYDPLTFRLCRIETRHSAGVLQDLGYTYDPAGNIVRVVDAAQQTYFFAGQVVTPASQYVYDPLYRLVQASGREHASLVGQLDEAEPSPWPLPHANDTQAVRRYTETYEYDEVGNLKRMAHAAGPTGSWTRWYEYGSTSNQLLGHSRPGDPPGVYSAKFGHDEQGCMSFMPHLPHLGWDASDLLATVDLGGGGTARYAYGGGGTRVRKAVERQGGAIVEERIYLGAYEVFRRWVNGALGFERQTVHVSDDTGRVALVETVSVDTSTPVVGSTPRQRYQLTNHLGSSIVEVDEHAAVISYEEYHPFGTTSLWLATGAAEVSVKRYRYTGVERDDETSLSHHGVRYYAPWLGRWTSPDPLGIDDDLNRYVYVSNDPVGLMDLNGANASPPRRSKRPIIELRKRTSPPHLGPGFGEWAHKTPKEILRHHERMFRERGPNPRRWINPPQYQAGHPYHAPFVTHGDTGGPMQWERPADNNAKDKVRRGQHPGADPAPLPEEMPKTPVAPAPEPHSAGTPHGEGAPKTTHAPGSSELVPHKPHSVPGAAAAEHAVEKSFLKEAGHVAGLVTKFGKVIPFIGIGFGVVGAGISLAEGDYLGFALDLVGFVPFVGDAVDAGRLIWSIGEWVTEPESAEGGEPGPESTPPAPEPMPQHPAPMPRIPHPMPQQRDWSEYEPEPTPQRKGFDPTVIPCT